MCLRYSILQRWDCVADSATLLSYTLLLCCFEAQTRLTTKFDRGPLLGPLISGFVSVSIGWRWVYWCELIFAGVTWPFLLAMPETFGPVLLLRKAEKLRKETGNPNIVAPAELEEQSWGQVITVVLTRPVRMFLFEVCEPSVCLAASESTRSLLTLFEAIVFFSCAYLSLAYGIFYSMCTSLISPD